MIVKKDSGSSESFRDRLEEAEGFHMGVGKVHETIKRLVADFDQAGIDYALVGAMALNAHGYRRETVDVDVLVRPEGLVLFVERFEGRGYLPQFPGARKSFRNTITGVSLDFITTGEYPGDGKPKPVVFPDPAKVSIDVEGVRVVDLPTLINLKLASGMTQPGRRRDLADVQDLTRLLKLNDQFADQLDAYVRDTYLMLVDELRQDEEGHRADDAGAQP